MAEGAAGPTPTVSEIEDTAAGAGGGSKRPRREKTDGEKTLKVRSARSCPLPAKRSVV